MAEKGTIVFYQKPKLRQPHMVCGINGWVDGGEAASGSIHYLVRKLRAKKFAEMPIDRFHIYQVPGQLSLRPQIEIKDGLLKEHIFPANQFFYWKNNRTGHDLVLFQGTEPNLNWEKYAGAILDLAEELGVARIYLPGGVLDKSPHTREAGVFCACTSEELREEMQRYVMQPSNYEGPGSFGTTLLYLARERKMPLVSMTARATYYPEHNVVIPRNPKSIWAIVVRLNSLLQINLDLSDLEREGKELEAKLNFMVSHNPDFQTYVDELEREYVELKYEEPLDISATEAVKLAEEYLREQEKE
jgi:proteasome assembly chaperone (PAC2) family protein